MNCLSCSSFPLVNTSRKYLRKLLFHLCNTSRISHFLSFDWPRKLVHAFVSQPCLLQCSILQGCPATNSNNTSDSSELSRLETHEPENTIVRPRPTVRFAFIGSEPKHSRASTKPKYFLKKINNENDSPRAQRTFIWSVNLDPTRCCFLDSQSLLLSKLKREIEPRFDSPTHSMRVPPSLLETDTDFSTFRLSAHYWSPESRCICSMQPTVLHIRSLYCIIVSLVLSFLWSSHSWFVWPNI